MKVFLVILLAIFGSAKSEFASLCKKPSGDYEVSNPNNCSTFIKCSGHKGTELPCMDGKLFDVKLSICRPPAYALCPANDVPQYVRDICKSQPQEQLVPGVECSKYYKCNGTNAIAFTCPNGQHYSRAYATCTNPLIAGCRALSAMCLDEYPGFGFSSLTCDKYFVCNNSLTPELISCQEGLYFSPDNQNCTDPGLSGCSNDETTTTTTTTGSPSGSCDNSPVPVCDSSDEGAFFPHSKPGWFYMCFNSEPLELQCESGLTYDTLLKYCVKDGANRVC